LNLWQGVCEVVAILFLVAGVGFDVGGARDARGAIRVLLALEIG